VWAIDRPQRRHRPQRLLAVAGCVWLVAWTPALRAQPSPVTDADIERARRSQPIVRDEDIEAARKRYGAPAMPAARSPAPPRPASPQVDRLPTPAATQPLDLDALARGYTAASSEQMHAAQRQGPTLYVFVSLSMRDAALQRLFEQARRAQATVVLRGFVQGSLKQTVARIHALSQGQPVPVQIDPRPFDRFGVTRVPSFVLLADSAAATGCTAKQCDAPDGHWRISGDVSLDYALGQMGHASGDAARATAPFLRRLDRVPR
jgi:conjugal transfer pilus assembly protein TrbC